MLGAMLKVNILRKCLDYSFAFKKNKVYVPRVETVECIKTNLK